MNIAVRNDYRRQGIARTLLDRLFELTAADGRRGYTLEVRVSNQGAAVAKLYEAMPASSRDGVRRAYYTRNNREDALIMACSTAGARTVPGGKSSPRRSNSR